MSKILQHLRNLYPNEIWKCQKRGFNWAYVTKSGWSAEFRSCLVSTSPNDSDGYAQSRLYLYRPYFPTEEIAGFASKIYAI